MLDCSINNILKVPSKIKNARQICVCRQKLIVVAVADGNVTKFRC